MSDETYDKDTGEIIPDGAENIEEDRGTPAVASHGSTKVIGMAVFLIFGIVAIGGIIYSEISKSQPVPVTQNEEITFRAPKTRGEPYIASPTIKTPP